MNTKAERSREAKKALVNQFGDTLAEAQELLDTSAGETAEKARDIRARVSGMLATAKESLAEIQDDMTEQAKAAAKFTDNYVRDNPWQTIGVTAAVAFLAGILVSRK